MNSLDGSLKCTWCLIMTREWNHNLKFIFECYLIYKTSKMPLYWNIVIRIVSWISQFISDIFLKTKWYVKSFKWLRQGILRLHTSFLILLKKFMIGLNLINGMLNFVFSTMMFVILFSSLPFSCKKIRHEKQIFEHLSVFFATKVKLLWALFPGWSNIHDHAQNIIPFYIKNKSVVVFSVGMKKMFTHSRQVG